MKVTGRKTSKMGAVSRLGLMALAMKETTKMGRSMARGFFTSQTKVFTKANSEKMKSQGRESTPGMMGRNTTGAGSTTKCMERVT